MRLWTALVGWWRSLRFRRLYRKPNLARGVKPPPRQAVRPALPPQRVERVVPGFSCSLTTSCYAVSGMRDDSWPGNVRRLSAAGLQLILRRRFEPGTFLRFDLENPSQTYSRTFFARVLKTRTEGGGEWALECSLSPECDEDDILALLS